MKTYELTVGKRSARFQHRDGEAFNEALSRGAGYIGYHGGAWAQPNLHIDRQVTVTDKPAFPRIGNSRQAYNGIVREV